MPKRSNMRAGLLWMLLVCLSDEQVSPHNCKVTSLVTVSKPGNVSISCPPVLDKASELKYVLILNGKHINQISLTKKIHSEDSLFPGLFQVTANSSGVYVCNREALYPPPHDEVCHITALVVIPEAQPLPLVNWTVPNTNLSCSQSLPEIMLWAGSGAVLLYSLLIHVIAIVLWRKMKRLKQNEDAKIYMNVRPGVAKTHSKA